MEITPHDASCPEDTTRELLCIHLEKHTGEIPTQLIQIMTKNHHILVFIYSCPEPQVDRANIPITP